jgi:hypothetical protein
MDSGMNYAGACDQDLARMHIRIWSRVWLKTWQKLWIRI